jgi:hypothetical protein
VRVSPSLRADSTHVRDAIWSLEKASHSKLAEHG